MLLLAVYVQTCYIEQLRQIPMADHCKHLNCKPDMAACIRFKTPVLTKNGTASSYLSALVSQMIPY